MLYTASNDEIEPTPGYEVHEVMTPRRRRGKGQTDDPAFTPTKEAPRQEYTQEQMERPVKEVLDGAMTVLEACRHFHIQSNQVHAWTGKALIDQWRATWPSILSYVAQQQERMGGPSPISLKATRVAGSDVPMVPLDMTLQLKLAIADMWIHEHSQELMTSTLPPGSAALVNLALSGAAHLSKRGKGK